MTDCCPPVEVSTGATCPACSTPSSPVEMATLKALLTPSALAELQLGAFHFCASSGCETVYFSDAGQVFRVTDVRARVWQKQPPGTRTFCYCFNENDADIQREIEDTGRTAAVERVRRHIAARRCACEVRNPRGSCCLGELMAAVKSLTDPSGPAKSPIRPSQVTR